MKDRFFSEHHHSARRRGASLRLVGLILSVLTAAVAVVIVIVVMAQRPGAGAGSAPPPPPPDIEPIDLAEAGRDPDDPLGYASGRMNWTSQNERGEIVQEFAWESLDPLEAGRFHVTRPKARFYLEGGETVYVEAATADVHRPANAQTPETGTFAGGVVVRIYEGHVRDDAPASRPTAILETESIDFDFTIGRLATTKQVYLTSRRVEFEGTGLDLLYNQVANRIEKLTVEKGRQLLYITRYAESDGQALRRIDAGSGRRSSPAATHFLTVANQDAPTQAAPSAAAASDEPAAAGGQDAQPDASGDVPQEDFYRIFFSGNVSVRQHTRVIHSAELTALVQLLDGELPLEDAPALTQRPPAAPATALSSARSAPPQRDLPTLLASLLFAQAAPAQGPADPMEPVRQSLLWPHAEADLLRINWSGPLSVRPLPVKPEKLAEDAAHIAFIGTPVQLEDEAADNQATCGSLEYFASRKEVALHSSLVHPVTMRDRNGSVVSGPEFALSLRTGLGRLVGAGRAVQGRADEAENASTTGLRLNWHDRLLVRFDVVNESPRDLREAICEGGVEVDHQDFRLTSDWLRLNLDPVQNTETGTGTVSEIRPSRISAKGSVHAMAYGSGELRCDEIDASLTADARGEAFPERIEVRGGVSGEDDLGRTLRAASAELKLLPPPAETPDADPTLERFLAWGDAAQPVVVDDADGLTAEGLELFVEEEGALMTLRGQPAQARRRDALIRGPELRIDELADLLVVEGAGDLDYQVGLASAGSRKSSRNGERRDKLQASWTQRLVYDGAADVIRCVGDVSALHEPQPAEINLLDCDDLTITLAEDAAVDGAGEPLGASGLLRLEAEGAASMEHRRFAAADRAQLERLLYIAGERLDYDNLVERLHVPTPGRLVVADESRYQQQRAAAADEAPASPPSSTAPTFEVGRTAFNWQGEMTFEPNHGSFVMRRNVEMRHRERPDEELLILECQVLTAATTPFSLDEQQAADDAELLHVVAEQAVYAEHGDRMLIADRIDYQALERLLTATAVPGNTVMTVRRGDIAPMRMDLFRWNLATDKVEMEGVQPIRVPRGVTASP